MWKVFFYFIVGGRFVDIWCFREKKWVYLIVFKYVFFIDDFQVLKSDIAIEFQKNQIFYFFVYRRIILVGDLK